MINSIHDLMIKIPKILLKFQQNKEKQTEHPS